MNKKSKFAERLKELRKERNMSQMDLALATHISQSAIGKWELGKTEPTASALIILADFLGETTDYLLGLTD
jgi:transcriptional regulator with XRE-family HTH domain